MAQACIYVKCFDSIREHPKMYALSEALKIPDYAAIGIIMGVSLWGARNTKDGEITGIPPRAIADAIHWKKKPEILIQALVDCGFIDKSENGRSFLHEFAEYGGKLEEARQKSRESSAAYRTKKNSSCDHDVTITSSSPSCQCDHDLKEEEKEEEEEYIKEAEEEKIYSTATAAAIKTYETNMGSINTTPSVMASIGDWCEKAGSDLVIACIEDVAKSGKKPWSYVEKRLMDWYERGLKTKEDVAAYLASAQPRGKPIKGAAARAFPQRGDQPGDLFEVF